MGDTSPHTPIGELLRDRAWIHGLARALVRDPEDAADAEQDAWVTALRRPPAQGPRLRGWWRTVLRSRAADAQRARQRRRAREDAVEALPPPATPEDLVERAELQSLVVRRVTELPEPTRITVLLRYFQSMSVHEIAEQLDVPATTIRSRLHRAHTALRTALEGDLKQRGRGTLACLLLPSMEGGRASAASLSATKSAVGVTIMTTAQKILVGGGILLLSLGGGALGASLVQPSAAEPVGSLPSAGATPESADAAGPALRGSTTSTDLATEDVATLREQVASLQGELAALRKQIAAQDPELLDLVRRVLPRFVEDRIQQGELGTIAATRNFASAHAQIQATGRIDSDRDGTGEFGGFREMSGAIRGRMEQELVPPVLSRRFRTLNEHGEVEVRGYLFRTYLPDRAGAGIGEPQEGFTPQSGVDADQAELAWCCYAWPVEYGVTGRRTFFMNQAGDTLSTDDARYSGAGSGPDAHAAFREAAITGPTARGEAGQDGNTWKHTSR